MVEVNTDISDLFWLESVFPKKKYHVAGIWPRDWITCGSCLSRWFKFIIYYFFKRIILARFFRGGKIKLATQFGWALVLEIKTMATESGPWFIFMNSTFHAHTSCLLYDFSTLAWFMLLLLLMERCLLLFLPAFSTRRYCFKFF